MTRNEKAIYWQRHVADYLASGLSGRAYAKRVGVSVSGLSSGSVRGVPRNRHSYVSV